MRPQLYLFFFLLSIAVSAQSYHTITLDGNNDFTTSAEQFNTTSGTNLYAYLTWDKNYLYVGLSGNSVSGSVTDGNRNYHIYIDTDPQKNPVSGTGTQNGEAWRNVPTLPFSANIHYVFKTADNAEFRRAYFGSWQNATFQTANWKGNGYWELRVSLADIGNPKQLNVLAYVEEDWQGGWLCGGLPANLFVNNNNGGSITFANHWENFYLFDQFIPNLAYNLDNFAWVVRLKAQSASLSDSTAFAGMALKATNDYDVNVDIPKPPTPPSNYLEVFFPHSDWLTALGPNFCRDIRAYTSLDSTTATWNFTVRTDKTNSQITLTADQLSFVPANYNIFIYDIAADLMHNVRTQGNYVYNSGTGGDKFFKLIVGVSLSSPHISTSTLTMNFGSVKVGKDSTINLTVSNTGDSALVISNITSTLSAFTFTGPTNYTITRNNSVIIPVKFSPSTATTYNGKLRFTSNDPQNPVLEVTLQGVGLALFPGILVSPSSLNFGNVKVDFDSTMTLKIYNPGDTTLSITSMATATARFKVIGATTFSINKKDSASVAVKFLPYAVIAYNDTLVIRNNTPATPEVRVLLSGSGTTAVVSHTFSRGWNLMSVPITQTNASTAAVIGDNLTNFLLFNYAGGVYVNADSVFAGKGYWLGIENAGLVDVNGTPSTTIVTQPFNTGWNLVASPFVRSYPKSKTQFKRGTITVSADSAVNLGWIQNVYYTFRQSDSSYTTSADLATWAGYFTGGLRDSLYIIFNHDSAGSLGKSIMPDKPAVDVNNWQVTIAANMNGRKDNLLAFGVGSKATDGFDTKYDYAKPPIAPVPGAIETYFQNTGWSPYFTKYGSDIRAPFVLPALGKQWSFKVFAQASGALTLSWTDIAAQIPQQIRESYSFLLSGSTVSMLNMIENTVYTFQAAGGSIYTFIINAAPTGIEQEPTVNFSYSLGQNFPNPFNPATTISYSLQYESTVQLTLYNSLGEIVRELVNTAQPAGEHTILFDANGLTSGVYYYAIKAQSPNGAMYRQSRKMVILK